MLSKIVIYIYIYLYFFFPLEFLGYGKIMYETWQAKHDLVFFILNLLKAQRPDFT